MGSLVEQLDVLRQVIDFSPYLSTESRQFLEKQLLQLSESIEDGQVTGLQGTKLIIELDQRAASDEVRFLMSKISHLNPSSPRLELLKDVAIQLESHRLSPEQTRKEIQKIMRY